MAKSKTQNYISIDLGTTNTIVTISGAGIVFNEPTIMSYNTLLNRIWKCGAEAEVLVGKQHKNIKIVKPLVDGVISDLDATEDFIRYIFGKTKYENILSSSIVLVTVPSEISETERDSLLDVLEHLGIGNIYIEEEVKMAALGSGIDILEPSGHMVVDIGGGTTDIAVIASGGIIQSKSIRIAGNFIDNEIINYIRSKYGLQTGQRVSRILKEKIGSAAKLKTELDYQVVGKDLSTSLPKGVIVNSREIRAIIVSALDKVVLLIKDILEQSQAEISADLIETGITLCGGGALLKNIDVYLSEQLHLPITVNKKPLLAVAHGSELYQDKITVLERQREQLG